MTTALVHTIAALREQLRAIPPGQTLGLVPTMGALHSGHARLIEFARRECARVVVSLFVNPLQFGPGEDYALYPRTLSQDLAFCERLHVDILFAPDVQELYPRPQRTFVDVERLTEGLCGRYRPGHFRGVTTVVLKLFNIVQPGRAYFGEKDAQQLAAVRRMVADLNLPVTVVGVPTVREESGLAFSSRNQHLNEQQRQAATSLFHALRAAQDRVAAGATDPAEVRAAALLVLERQPEVRVQYLEVVEPDEMQPVERITGPVRVAAAILVGTTRLIDNLLCQKKDGS